MNQETRSYQPGRSWQLFGLVVLVVGLALTLFITNTANADDSKDKQNVFTVEIAEDGSRFSFDEAPVHESDGLPAYGSAFVTQGYIYPAGTLSCSEEGCNGVLADGSPEFPDKVIGEWSCWGYHVGDGAHTQSGPIVVTTQMYSFGNVPGAKMLTTIGYELADFNKVVSRAVAGGTGAYRAVSGEQSQELLGWNPSVGVSLRVKFDLKKVKNE